MNFVKPIFKLYNYQIIKFDLWALREVANNQLIIDMFEPIKKKYSISELGKLLLKRNWRRPVFNCAFCNDTEQKTNTECRIPQ